MYKYNQSQMYPQTQLHSDTNVSEDECIQKG